jgi:hypothetical protein
VLGLPRSYKFRGLVLGIGLVLRGRLLECRQSLAAVHNGTDRGEGRAVDAHALGVVHLGHEADVRQRGGDSARGVEAGVLGRVGGHQLLDGGQALVDHLHTELLRVGDLAGVADQLNGLHLAQDREVLQGLNAAVHNLSDLPYTIKRLRIIDVRQARQRLIALYLSGAGATKRTGRHNAVRGREGVLQVLDDGQGLREGQALASVRV